MSDAPKFKRHRRNNNIHVYTGLMNSPIKVLKKTYFKDSMGFESYETKEVCRAWAKVEYAKTGVTVDNTASVYGENLKFTIYFHPEVDDTCLIEYNGKQYQTVSVENVEQNNKYLIITTENKGGR